MIAAVKKACEAKFVDVINAQGEFQAGDIRYYVGIDKRTKLRVSQRDALDVLMTAAHGDMNEVARCMSSSAIKYGQVKASFGDDVFGEFFEAGQFLLHLVEQCFDRLSLKFSRAPGPRPTP